MFTTYFLILLSATIQANNDFCRTKDGDPGKCLQAKFCSFSKEKCGDDTVCCPIMQKIVTPSSTPSPSTSNPPVPIFPTVTSTEKMIIRSAQAKCEEYKSHTLKKRASVITYVLGGTPSIGKEFPHMAILGYGTTEKVDWLCGGSLISDRYVLTAAHCLLTSNLGELIRVRLGELNLQSIFDDARPQDFGVEQKFIHPDYRAPSQYNDIALIKLDRKVDFDEYIFPICLQVNKDLPNTQFVATGWGKTELGGSQSAVLMKVDLEYYPNNVCQKTYDDVAVESLPRGIVDDIQICAGSRYGDRDTCQGDSGGPLQIRDDTVYLVGITSFGKACGIADSPAVYSRVSYYVSWIEQLVWP